jgi:4'-phosphopantetheinyl transferase
MNVEGRSTHAEAADWPRLTGAPVLAARDVHVWRLMLNASDAAVDALTKVLSADERERAARFRFDRDRRRFVVARSGLRRVLGRYVGVAPELLAFEYGPYGKPRLLDRPTPVFNVSHSEEWALIAVSADGVLGIDIEAVRELDDRDALAASVFSATENACLSALPAADRLRAFFRCWTRKEAFVKATGDGLARSLVGFDVTFAPGEAPALSIPADPPEAARWMVASLEPVPGFEVALVADGQGRNIRYWTLPAMDAGLRCWAAENLEEAI